MEYNELVEAQEVEEDEEVIKEELRRQEKNDMLEEVKDNLTDNIVSSDNIWKIKDELYKMYNSGLGYTLENYENILDELKTNQKDKKEILGYIEDKLVWDTIENILNNIIIIPSDMTVINGKTAFTDSFYERKNVSKINKDKVRKLLKDKKYS